MKIFLVRNVNEFFSPSFLALSFPITPGEDKSPEMLRNKPESFPLTAAKRRASFVKSHNQTHGRISTSSSLVPTFVSTIVIGVEAEDLH